MTYLQDIPAPRPPRSSTRAVLAETGEEVTQRQETTVSLPLQTTV